MMTKSELRPLAFEGFAAEINSYINRLLLVNHNKMEAYECMMTAPCSKIGSKITPGNRTLMGYGVVV